MIYRIRTEWDLAKSQIGAYSILSNAIKACPKGYNVYDESGYLIYFYPQKLGDKCPYNAPTNVLRYNSHGDDVKWLQWQLINLGFFCGKAGIDGWYGQGTYKGVQSYQIANNLEVDGICGPQTRKSLIENGVPSVNPAPAPTPSKFVPRLTIPEKGNPYYNRIQNGGYGTSIPGYPLQAGLTCLSNCVGHAAARFNEIGGYGKWKYLNYPPNAEDFIDAARAQGLQISQTPSLGAIIVWAKGKTHNSSDGAGHVAVVEKINSDGSIITSESGYNCSNPFWTTKRYNTNGNWGNGSAYKFIGFIVNPAVK